MRLRARTPPAETPLDRLWGEVGDRWGLGQDEKGKGYRERLRRLSDFLGELDPEPGTTLDDEAVDFEKLQRGLGGTPVPEATEAYLCRLEELGRAMAAILHGMQEVYLERSQAWPHKDALVAGKWSAEIERALRNLGALPPAGAPAATTAPNCLLALRQGIAGSPADDDARRRWSDCVHNLAADYEWAYFRSRCGWRVSVCKRRH